MMVLLMFEIGVEVIDVRPIFLPTISKFMICSCLLTTDKRVFCVIVPRIGVGGDTSIMLSLKV